MQAKKTEQSILQTVAKYRTKFAQMSEADFVKQPPIGGWCYSEVYLHIFDASLLSFRSIAYCLSGKAKEKPTHFSVKLMLWYGAFPPRKRYKVPKSLAERVKKISKVEAETLMNAMEKKLSLTAGKVQLADRNKKIKHPRLGYLNAQQWFRFIEIHLKHHLKQLTRIEKSFKQRI
ncbi:hypothetical protein ABIB40_001201 [Pedobacter sp. UYP30]|uniref:DinB family protein n=1 Tax=Pedobacter sp. UYP30 TaxID=1756400 RepID=UPI003394C706